MRLCLVALAMLSGCASTVPATVTTMDKPVTVPCRIKWPKPPTPHVANFQPSGNAHVDALLIERAKEAELEEHRAYLVALEAAAINCLEPS